MEHAVKPLLEAANTQEWRDVLNILYLSGSVAAFSEELQIPCLVSAEGPYDEIERSRDLLQGKATVAITPLMKDLVRMLLPRIMVVLQKREVLNALEEDNEEILNLMMIAEIQGELEKHQRDLARIMVQGASTLSDLISIGVFSSLLEIRDSHVHSALDEDEYEEMVEGLRKLGLVEARLQVSMCPECANYQFTISRHPLLVENCPKCGTEWATVTFYSLQHPFSEAKIDNSDLPLFISSYLRHKIASEAPTGNAHVFPKATIKSEDGKEAEVDVYLPELGIGIECKVFEDAYARLTQARLGSIAGKIAPQIERYFGAGISRVAVATNLPEGSRSQLETALQKRLAKDWQNQTIEVLGGDVDSLLEWLDTQALTVAIQVQNSLNKAFEKATEEEGEGEAISKAPPDRSKGRGNRSRKRQDG